MQRSTAIPPVPKSIEVPLLDEPHTTCHLDWAMIDRLDWKPNGALPEKMKPVLEELAEKGPERYRNGVAGILELLKHSWNMGSILYHDRVLSYWMLEVPNGLGDILQFLINDTDDTEFNNRIIYRSVGSEPFVLTASSGDRIQLIRNLFDEVVR